MISRVILGRMKSWSGCVTEAFQVLRYFGDHFYFPEYGTTCSIPKKTYLDTRANILQTTRILLRRDVQHQNFKNWMNGPPIKELPPGLLAQNRSSRNEISINQRHKRQDIPPLRLTLHIPPSSFHKSQGNKDLLLSIYHQPSPIPSRRTAQVRKASSGDA